MREVERWRERERETRKNDIEIGIRDKIHSQGQELV